jgi:hypothetical protein
MKMFKETKKMKVIYLIIFVLIFGAIFAETEKIVIDGLEYTVVRNWENEKKVIRKEEDKIIIKFFKSNSNGEIIIMGKKHR